MLGLVCVDFAVMFVFLSCSHTSFYNAGQIVRGFVVPRFSALIYINNLLARERPSCWWKRGDAPDNAANRAAEQP